MYLLLAAMGMAPLAVLFIIRTEIVFWLLLIINFTFGSISAYLPWELTTLRGVLELSVVVGGLAIALCAMAIQPSLQKRLFSGPVLWFSLLWTLATLLAALIGVDQWAGSGEELERSAADVVKFLLFSLFLPMAVWVVRAIDDLDLLLFRLLMIFGGFLVFNLVRFVWMSDFSTRLVTGVTEFSVPYVFIALYLLQRMRSRGHRAVLIGLLLASFLAIGLSQTRALIVGVGIGLIAGLMVGRGETRLLVTRVLGLLMGTGLAIVMLPISGEYPQILKERLVPVELYVGAGGMPQWGQRIDEAKVVAAQFERSPEKLLFGFGFGTRLEYWTPGTEVEGFWRKDYTTHSTFLAVLWRTGMFGLVTLLTVVGWFLREAWHLRYEYPLARYIFMAIIANLVPLNLSGVRNLFEHMIMYVLYACLLALREEKGQLAVRLVWYRGNKEIRDIREV